MTNNHEQTQAEIEQRAQRREKKGKTAVKSSGQSVRELQRIIVKKGSKTRRLDNKL